MSSPTYRIGSLSLVSYLIVVFFASFAEAAVLARFGNGTAISSASSQSPTAASGSMLNPTSVRGTAPFAITAAPTPTGSSNSSTAVFMSCSTDPAALTWEIERWFSTMAPDILDYCTSSAFANYSAWSSQGCNNGVYATESSVFTFGSFGVLTSTPVWIPRQVAPCCGACKIDALDVQMQLFMTSSPLAGVASASGRMPYAANNTALYTTYPAYASLAMVELNAADGCLSAVGTAAPSRTTFSVQLTDISSIMWSGTNIITGSGGGGQLTTLPINHQDLGPSCASIGGKLPLDFTTKTLDGKPYTAARCNPGLAIPAVVFSARPDWTSCQDFNGGLYDPPTYLSAQTGLIPDLLPNPGPSPPTAVPITSAVPLQPARASPIPGLPLPLLPSAQPKPSPQPSPQPQPQPQPQSQPQPGQGGASSPPVAAPTPVANPNPNANPNLNPDPQNPSPQSPNNPQNNPNSPANNNPNDPLNNDPDPASANLRNPRPVVPVTALPSNGVAVGGVILHPGDPAITVSNAVVSAAASNVVIVNSSPFALAPPKPPPTPVAFTIGAESFSVLPSGNGIVVGGTQIVAAGSAATISGQRVSLAPSGIVVLGTSSFAIPQPPPQATPAAAFTVGPDAFTFLPSSNAGLVIGTQTIHPGAAAVTVSGEAISLGPSGFVVVGSSTISLPPQATPAPDSVFAIGSDSFTVLDATAGSPAEIIAGGATVTAGGAAATIDGVEVSLGPSALIVGSRTEVWSYGGAGSPTATPDIGNLILSGIGLVGGTPVTETLASALPTATLLTGGAARRAGDGGILSGGLLGACLGMLWWCLS